jgi:hypothetical protein
MLKEEIKTGQCRDANIRRDTNISGITRSSGDFDNSRTRATTEKLIAA